MGTILSSLIRYLLVPAALGNEEVFLSQGSILDLSQKRHNRSPPKCLCIIINGNWTTYGCQKQFTPSYLDAVSPANKQIRMLKLWWPSTTYATPSKSNLLNLLIHMAGKPHETLVSIPFPHYACNYSDEQHRRTISLPAHFPGCTKGQSKDHLSSFRLALALPHCP